MIKFACPQCRQRLKHATANDTVTCPACGRRVRVPTEALPSAPFAPPPPIIPPPIRSHQMSDEAPVGHVATTPLPVAWTVSQLTGPTPDAPAPAMPRVGRTVSAFIAGIIVTLCVVAAGLACLYSFTPLSKQRPLESFVNNIGKTTPAGKENDTSFAVKSQNNPVAKNQMDALAAKNLRTVSVEPETDDEKAVATLILKYATKPERVRFLTWGPHDLVGSAVKVDVHGGKVGNNGEDIVDPKKFKLIRVVFLPFKGGPQDWIMVFTHGDLSTEVIKNNFGDDWMITHGRWIIPNYLFPLDIRSCYF